MDGWMDAWIDKKREGRYIKDRWTISNGWIDDR